MSDAIARYLNLYKTARTQLTGASNPPWLAAVRDTAIEQFAAQGFPTLRQEEWRFTNTAPIAELEGELAGTVYLNGSTPNIAGFVIPQMPGGRLVFVNGLFHAQLSTMQTLPEGAFVGSLAEAIAAGHPVVQEHLGQHADAGSNPFTALNTALHQDGAFIYLPKNARIAEPIHLLFMTTSPQATTLAHPRNLIVASANSQVTVLEHYARAQQNAVYFNNPVTEVVAGENAVIDHYKLQQESLGAYHVSTMQVQQARDCTFSSLSVTFGGKLARNDANAIMSGRGVTCTLNGLFLINSDQHVDNHTLMDHAHPHCNSHEFYAGILDDKSHGVFNGKILVRHDAQKTDAKQTNRNLLLSRHAVIDTKPQLEIFADDVKCTHGATIGQLNEDALFYLRARGIPKTEARDLLVYAFANEVLGSVKVEPLRVCIEKRLLARLARTRHQHKFDDILK